MANRDETTAVGAQLPEALESHGASLRPAILRGSFLWQRWLYLAATVGLYYPYMGYLWNVWMTVPEYTHAVFLPMFSGLMLWKLRDEILRERGTPSWWSVPLVLAGSLTFLVGTLLSERFTVGVSLLLVLLGGLLAVGGVPLFRAAWFPLAFLGFGIPLPDGVLIGTLGDPLRDQAARWSADLLDALGYSLLLDGTQLRLPRITLEVGYECSGIRGLIAAAPLGAAFAYMFHSSWWQRALLLLAAVPIGLASNILRVVAISIRVYDFPSAPTLAELHGPTAWVPVLFIVPSLLLISWLMRWADQRLLSGSR